MESHSFSMDPETSEIPGGAPPADPISIPNLNEGTVDTDVTAPPMTDMTTVPPETSIAESDPAPSTTNISNTEDNNSEGSDDPEKQEESSSKGKTVAAVAAAGAVGAAELEMKRE